MNIRQNLFGKGPKADREQTGYGRPPAPPPRDDGPMGGYDGSRGDRGSYGAPAPSPRQAMTSPPAVGSAQPASPTRRVQLSIAKFEDKTLANQYVFGNLCAVSPQDFPPSRDGSDLYILINRQYVMTARPTNMFPPGCISMSDPQRTYCNVGMVDPIIAELYDPFSQGPQTYLGALGLEVGFASVKKSTDVPYDQNVLADVFIKTFQNQIFAPGQRLIMDHKNIFLIFTVKTVQLVNLSVEMQGSAPTMTTPASRGILTRHTSITFYKDAKSPIKFKVGAVVDVGDGIENLKVNRGDFINTLEEAKPAFSVSEEELETAIRAGILHFSPYIGNILKDGGLFVDLVKNSATTPLFSVLLHGPLGSGKTALAARIAKDSGFPFIKIVSAEKMVGFSEMAKIEHLNKAFTDAYESPQNIIVIDNIERIIEWVPIGPRFSNPVLQALMVLLTRQPPNPHRLLIIGTTSQRSVMRQLDFQQLFNRELAVPNINTHNELTAVLREVRAFDNDSDLAESLNELRDITSTDRVGIGIKKVLLAIAEAKQDKGNVIGRFAEVIALQMAASVD